MRKWLNDNEIIFKTIGWTIVSIVAVFVSIQANTIADKQTLVAEQQANLLKQQYLPMINFITKYDGDDITFVLSNQGHAIYDLGVYIYVIGVLSIDDNLSIVNESFSLKKAYIKIADSLPMEISTIGLADSTTKPIIISSEGNLERFMKLDYSLRQIGRDQYAWTQLQRMCIFKVIYSDIFGLSHSDIYYYCGFCVLKATDAELITACEQAINFCEINDGFFISLDNPETLINNFDLYLEKSSEFPLLDVLLESGYPK